MLLFGVLRRTLRNGLAAESWRASAEGMAAAIVTLWVLHPIHTEAVNYLVQRTELLASLCYAATVYAWIRGWEASSARTAHAWRMLALLACVAGAASKEIIVTAPLIVMLYDRSFRVRSWRELL